MLTLTTLIDVLRQRGATRFFAKKLAPNDNSKNQIYLGGDFSALGLLPHGPVFADASDVAGSIRDRAKATLSFVWYSDEGLSQAPNAQLILYPKYPEVRLSGLLQGCKAGPNDVLTVRDDGRVLVFGIHPDGTIFGFACFADHPVAQEIDALTDPEMLGVFILLTGHGEIVTDTRNQLMRELREIHLEGWINSQKLNKAGIAAPYAARNGGGYTLEARLGISPNGYAAPDYLGWEIKQFGVNDLKKPVAKSQITLMTPEPTDGLYSTRGPEAFVRRYGYKDKSGKVDRINFGGRYLVGKPPHKDTGLKLQLSGYNTETGKIEDMAGAICLVTQDGETGAAWPYTSLIDHWNLKHARAAYIPSIRRDTPVSYAYGSIVSLYQNTDFLKFLAAIAVGDVAYDPALKLEHASTDKPKLKRRSQFRTRQTALASLYETGGQVDLL